MVFYIDILYTLIYFKQKEDMKKLDDTLRKVKEVIQSSNSGGECSEKTKI